MIEHNPDQPVHSSHETDPMLDKQYRAGMLDANEALRLLAALVVFTMVGVFGYAILTGVETITTIAALVLLVLLTLAFMYVFFSPTRCARSTPSRRWPSRRACSPTSRAASRARAPSRSAVACCPRRAP